LREGARLLGQVEALDAHPFLLQPVEIRGKTGQLRIDARTADPGGAAQRRIIDDKFLHIFLTR